MATKRCKFEILLYTSLLLIVCFEKTVGKSRSSGSHGHSHTSHSSSHGSHGGHGGNGGHVSHPHPSVNHPSINHPSRPPSHDSSGSHSHYQPHPDHSVHSPPSSIHTPPPYVHHPIPHPPGTTPHVGWNPDVVHPHPSLDHQPQHPNGGSGVNHPTLYPPERSSHIGWNPDVVHPHPSLDHQPQHPNGGSGVNHPTLYPPGKSPAIGWDPDVYPHPSSDHQPQHPNGGSGINHPTLHPPSPIIIHPDNSQPIFHPSYHHRPFHTTTTSRPNYYDPALGRHEEPVRPVGKPLVSDKSLPSSRTNCGMTLCPNVMNYPSTEINDAVSRANQMFSSGKSTINGISKQNFTTKKAIFSYGRQDFTSSCLDHRNTIYPQEGFSSDDNKTYYVVNVSNLSQGLVNIQCQSSYQTCTKHNDVSTSMSKMCRQMYREEQLLVLPTNKRTFTVFDFELKKFHVPTGCDCIAY